MSITLLQEKLATGEMRQLPGSDDPDSLDIKPGDMIQCEIKVIRGDKNKRNALMNRCLHKWSELAAKAMNQQGYDIVKVMTMQGLDCPWGREDPKEKMFKPVLKALTGNDKTKDASNDEFCKVEERLGKFFAEKLGLVIVWPSNQPPAWRNYED